MPNPSQADSSSSAFRGIRTVNSLPPAGAVAPRFDSTAVEFGQRLDQGEADPQAAGHGAVGSSHLGEDLEDLSQHLPGNAQAVFRLKQLEEPAR